ncbi:polysaccharide biosynthesis C-terminal domain-containing protein [Exiguobacterium sp. s39]|uniref:oligosaccharide flippase family protein n=1 Tax=Exiguobacterium sp. s39 TaxID=2751198 RepID=UPI001BEC4FCF|nr:polysaccharide biosynthesis C-terminal domain-containing protein [Exiguobacterium sp. s39]
MNSLKLKSIFLGVNKVIILSSNILLLMILSRGLSIDEYGEYRLLTTYLLILNTILTFGIPSAIMYFLNKNNNAFLNELLFLTTMISFVSPVVYTIFLLLIGDYSLSLMIVLILVFLLNLLSLWQDNFYIIYDKIRLLFSSNVSANGFLICSIAIGTYFFNWDLKEVFIAMLIRELIKLIYFFIFLISVKKDLKVQINKSDLNKIIAFIIPLFIASLVTVVNMNIDKIYGSIFFTKKEFAFLANASYEIPIMSLLGYAVFNTLIPKIRNLQHNKREVTILWNRVGEIMIVIIFSIIIPLIFFSKETLSILFSEEYEAAYLVFIMYQLSALSRIYIYSTIFLALEKNKVYLMNTVINLIVNSILIVFFGWIFGIYGVALAMLLTNISLMIRQNIQLKKYLDCSILEIYPLKKFLQALLIGLIISGSIFIIYKLLYSYDPLTSLIFIFINVILLFIVYSFTINKEIVEFLWRVLVKK